MNGNVLLTYIEGGNHVKTSLTGLVVGVDVTISEKLWNTFQAIGNIAFAYSFSTVIAEIQASIKFKQQRFIIEQEKLKTRIDFNFFTQDTLKSNPPENQVMKKSSLIGITISTIFYSLCGLLGYEAFGNKAPGNFLTGFGFYEPYWLVDIGNLFIIIHLVGAYQVN